MSLDKLTRFRIGDDEFVVICIDKPQSGTLGSLTAAEMSVVHAVLEGKSNGEIGLARGTSARTVANQLACIYRKLGIGSRSELALTCAGPRSKPTT
jgi:DNA-binding NarL/FixJ family response regulator